MASRETHAYRARWIFPVTGEPLDNATIVVENGLIVELHQNYDPRAVNLGEVALIPGLVNVHTHLEFSELAEPLPATSFPNWIAELVQYRRSLGKPLQKVVAAGLTEAQESGCTTLGEICTYDWHDVVTSPIARPRTIVFEELIALSRDQIDEKLLLAREHLQSTFWADEQTTLGGLSPHAPYSVHPELFRQSVSLARELRVPLAIHLAETKEELELLAEGTGTLADLMSEFGPWDRQAYAPETAPLDYLELLGTLSRALAVHGNYLSKREIAYLAGHPHVTVVYCPRTHAHFGHDPHPWLELLDAGASVALGTDSRASNPDLSIWRELLYLHEEFPDVDCSLLLELGTTRGAWALGLERKTGRLVAGTSADIAMISLESENGRSPYDRLFSPRNRPIGTMLAGDWLTYPLG